jgi:hypothetical protein
MKRTSLWISLIGLLLCVSSCESFEPRNDHSPFSMGSRLRHISGPILSVQNQTNITDQVLNKALLAELSFYTLERFPKRALEAAGAHVRLIANSHKLWQPVAKALAGVRFRQLDRPELTLRSITDQTGQQDLYKSFRTALPAGVTAAFDLVRQQSSRQPRRWSVLLHRRRDHKFSLALETHSWDQDSSQVQTETMIFEDVRGQRLSFLVLVPGPIDYHPVSLAIIVTIKQAPVLGEQGFRDFRKRLAGCRRDLRQASPGWPLQALEAKSNAIEISKHTIRALSRPDQRRVVLAGMAQRLGANLMEDMILTAHKSVVARLAADTLSLIPTMPASAEASTWAWSLENIAYKAMGEMWTKDKIPAEIESVFVRHAGALAWLPSLFIELIEASSGLDDMRQRILSKNQELLSSPSPNIRLQAYDWLKIRGRAPQGYDPLETQKESRGQ